MDVIVARQGALDVHKAQVTACVRVPGAEGQRVGQVKQFKTTVPGLLVLADWLRAHGVTHVVMEATGDYWKPIWHLLEAEFELMLVNARDVKQVPGRKIDVKDSEWLCQLAQADPRPAAADPLPAHADQRAHARSAAAAQGARGHRHQACLRGDRHPRQERPRHAERARRRHDRP